MLIGDFLPADIKFPEKTLFPGPEMRTEKAAFHRFIREAKMV